MNIDRSTLFQCFIVSIQYLVVTQTTSSPVLGISLPTSLSSPRCQVKQRNIVFFFKSINSVYDARVNVGDPLCSRFSSSQWKSIVSPAQKTCREAGSDQMLLQQKTSSA